VIKVHRYYCENTRANRFLEQLLVTGSRHTFKEASQLFRRVGEIGTLGDFALGTPMVGEAATKRSWIEMDANVNSFRNAGGIVVANHSFKATSADQVIRSLEGTRGITQNVSLAWVKRLVNARWQIDSPTEAYMQTYQELAEQISAHQHAAREALIERDSTFGSW
jgi:hypothetical protein